MGPTCSVMASVTGWTRAMTRQQPVQPPTPSGEANDEPIIQVANLSVHAGDTPLIHGVDFVIGQGERIGLIGASGSGKSLTAQAIASLLPTVLTASGSVRINAPAIPAALRDHQAGAGQHIEVIGAKERTLAKVRGATIGMIFQDPRAALDPLVRVGDALASELGISRWQRDRRRAPEVVAALADVGLQPKHAHRRPHELSGGQCQRIGIALALANNPALLIADEPTTALDALTQAQIIALLQARLDANKTALLFISHDLALTQSICENGLIMDKGAIVARGAIATVMDDPHPAVVTLSQASAAQRVTAVPCNPPDRIPVLEAPPPAVVFDAVTRIHRGAETPTLDEVSLTIPAQHRIGIVGASGAGKTTLVRLIAGLNLPTAGTVAVNGRVQMVFQHPKASFNPRLRLRVSLEESLHDAQPRLSAPERAQRIAEVLASVDLPAQAADRYPGAFSGGQLQRLAIARAVLGEADILIADEPVSALDVAVREQVLQTLEAHAHGRTLIMVSHDFAPVAQLCDTVVVMSSAKIVEMGPTRTLFEHPKDPYTAQLVAATRFKCV